MRMRMSGKLETKFVYLDTSIIYKNNFNFTNEKFQKLIEYVEMNQIELLFNTITINEIKQNIYKSINHAKNKFESIRNDLTILKNIDAFQYFDNFNSENFKEYTKTILNQFKTFLQNIKYTKIPTTDLMDVVINDYFNNNPPFDKKEKKNEFPDAILFHSLLNWCKKFKRKAYFITGDDDYKRIVESNFIVDIIILNSLEEFLDLVSSTLTPENEEVKNFLFQHVDEITEYVKMEFESMGVEIDNSESELIEIKVEDVEIKAIYNVSLTEEKLVFAIDPIIEFNAEIHYENYDNATYDREDGVWYNVREENIDLFDSIQLNFIVNAIIDLKNNTLILPEKPLHNFDNIIIHFDPHDDCWD